MSARRANDPAAPAQPPPPPIGKAISALADRLPAATRLNYVLAAGAKKQLALGGGQARKVVDTAGYARSEWHHGYKYVNQKLEDLADKFKRSLSRIDVDWKPNGPHDHNREMCMHILEFQDPSVLDLFNTRADADLLREKGAYIILNSLMQQASPHQKALAREALQEAMYYDRDRVGAFGEMNTVRGELEEGERALGIPSNPALGLPKPTLNAMKALNEDILYGNHGQRKPSTPMDALKPKRDTGKRNPLKDFGAPKPHHDRANQSLDDTSSKYPGSASAGPPRVYDDQR